MSLAIKVENLSKAYQLGEIGTGTISRDLERWFAKVRGKEDPFLKIGEANDRAVKGTSDVVWSLKDINFEIEQGEAVGIIGRNGAGKSTLLKLLSRVTSPTTGEINVKGRIASLLEVGTGFHPELTGRENIYLNGAILGMRKKEITRKFDEILDFAGVERYVDTPVKRYSSGMYVRLAFAVAAYLESEILIVDEVLAVGDADFQKKCLGKMGQVSKGEGRTVLFVSHNLSSITTLCSQGILLEEGKVIYDGMIDRTIDLYTDNKNKIGTKKEFALNNAPGNEFARILSVSVEGNKQKNDVFDIKEEVFIEIKYFDNNSHNKNTAVIHVKDGRDNLLFASNEFNNESWDAIHNHVPSIITAICKIPSNFLAEGKYTILAAVASYSPNIIHSVIEEAVSFTIADEGLGDTVKKMVSVSWPGLIRPFLDWQIVKEKII